MAMEFIEKIESIDSNESVAKAITLITKNQNGSLAVTKNGKYIGLVDDRILRDFKGSAENTKIGKYASKPEKLNKNSSPEEIVTAFLDNVYKAVPVLDKEKCVGAYTRAGALNFVAQASAIKGKQVGDVANMSPRLVNQSSSVTQALNEMKKAGVHKLPVVDDQGFLQGLVTSFDVVTKASASARKQYRENKHTTNRNILDELIVEKIMSSNVLTCSQDESLEMTVKKMIANKKASAIVLKANKPIGLLTARNCFNACVVQTAPAIDVSGLEKDEKALKQSITDEAARMVEKLGKSLDINLLSLKIKSVQQGTKRRYQVKGKMTVNQQLLVAQTPDNSKSNSDSSTWDLHMAIKLVLDELKTQAIKLKPSKKKSKFSGEEE